MAIRLFDSRMQSVVPLVPLVPGRVGMYVCGPTVQSSPHVGHLRSALSYDILRRWLEHRGLEVTLIRNVTDIDDKILQVAAVTDEQWWALAYRVELEFSAAYAAIGVRPPTYEPRATANVDAMQRMIERLIDGGHAYPAADDSGDVYFDVASWPAYGELTRQHGRDLISGDETDARARRDPRDFALWKGRKATEPQSASWPSPWGSGRPGWHIECSAMAERYLGARFDIHGGGLDLRFPHHENELAQSGACGLGFASLWVHNGLVTIAGQKMSKSLGNSVFAADLLAAAPAVVVRYALAAAHYRSPLDYHEGALAEAAEAMSRIERFLDRAEQAGVVEYADAALVPERFAAAMDDDIGVPVALAVLHETVRAGNTALDAGYSAPAAIIYGEVRAMTSVLGLDPRSPEWRTDRRGADDDSAEVLAALVQHLIDERRTARESKDWVSADRIRASLSAAGIELADGAGATRWSRQT